MRILLAANMSSGRGHAQRLAHLHTQTLGAGGHEVELADVRACPADELSGAMARHDLLVIIGGDGTVHSQLKLAIEQQKPVYQIPTGTENLFAREFGMDRKPATLLAAIETARVLDADVGFANGKPFVIMASAGLDANVIHRLAAVRNGPIRRLSYLPHILAEIKRPAFPRLTITADGEEIVKDGRGLVIIANSRQYAMNLNPAADALISDGRLDVVFLPMQSRWQAVSWMAAAARKFLVRNPRRIHARCSTAHITSSNGPASIQIDGEMPGCNGEAHTPLAVTVRERCLRVLVPTRSWHFAKASSLSTSGRAAREG